MKTIKYVSLVLIVFVLIMRCSGIYGELKTQSESDSRITQKELIDNWSDYDIRFKSTVIVYDPNNNDKKILVGSYWGTIKDQATWTEFVKANMTSQGDFSPVGAPYAMTGIREIWSPDNQFYGYVVHQVPDSVGAVVVDENTMRLHHHTAHYGGPGPQIDLAILSRYPTNSR